MKKMKLYFGTVLALLLAAMLILTGCTDGQGPDAETTVESTEAADTPAETNPTTDPETDPETNPPADLTADELKTILAAAIEAAEQDNDVGMNVRMLMGDSVLADSVITVNGGDFIFEQDVDYLYRITVVGDKGYILQHFEDEEDSLTVKQVMSLDEEQKAELYGLFVGESDPVADAELSEALLNSTLAGSRAADGSVEITCTELDAAAMESLMGENMEGCDMIFKVLVNGNGKITFMGFTVEVPAELTGGEAMTISSEISIDYDVPTITAPEDASEYEEIDYDELFGFQLPEIDPEEAASLGLPVDGDNYTVGGQDSAYDAEIQYFFLFLYAPCYADKTFTIYGNLLEDENGNVVVSVGDGMNFPVSFDGADEPALSSYVKVTATFTQTVSREDMVDFDCFTMIVTECEALGEAVGPNGGKLMYITASVLNVRTSSDTSADNILGALYCGDMVEVFGQDENGWYHIIFEGQDAYISYKYVSETKPD